MDIEFKRLQIADGNAGQTMQLGVFTSAQLYPTKLAKCEDSIEIAPNMTFVPPQPIVQTETQITLQSTATSVTMTTQPPTAITIGKAFTVVCRVSVGSAPLGRQLVSVNISSNSVGSAVASADSFFENLFAPANEAPALTATKPRLVGSSTNARTGVYCEYF